MMIFRTMKYRSITGKSVGALKANYFHALRKIKEQMIDNEK